MRLLFLVNFSMTVLLYVVSFLEYLQPVWLGETLVVVNSIFLTVGWTDLYLLLLLSLVASTLLGSYRLQYRTWSSPSWSDYKEYKPN